MSRKEYMIEAEESILRMMVAYHKDHDKIPDTYSVLKSALTRAHSFAICVINREVAKRLGVKYGHNLVNHPDYNKVVSSVIEDISCDVQGFRLRQQAL